MSYADDCLKRAEAALEHRKIIGMDELSLITQPFIDVAELARRLKSATQALREIGCYVSRKDINLADYLELAAELESIPGCHHRVYKESCEHCRKHGVLT